MSADLFIALKDLEWACSGVDYMETEYSAQLSAARAAIREHEATLRTLDMLSMLQRLTHPAADDQDLEDALELLRQIQGDPQL